MDFQDFTIPAYRKLLKSVKDGWDFVTALDSRKPGRICFWRHDVDFSLERAYRLAEIETEQGVVSTYFINLHSRFYNPLESESSALIHEILKMGHSIGLHFDPSFYTVSPDGRWRPNSALEHERNILSTLFCTNVDAFSVHNPGTTDFLRLDVDELGGMVNVYGPYFKNNFVYCSDSNGFWQDRRLEDVLKPRQHTKLHILTHPGWWSEFPLSPRERVKQSIETRARRTMELYDQTLRQFGRKNIG